MPDNQEDEWELVPVEKKRKRYTLRTRRLIRDAIIGGSLVTVFSAGIGGYVLFQKVIEDDRDAKWPTPGQDWTIPELGLEMIWIEPGTFTMGSPEDEPGRHPHEGPQTVVTFAEGFWIGKYPVTQEEFEEIMGFNPSLRRDNPRLPVDRVSWEDAMEFGQRLTQRERELGRLPLGMRFTLPAEEQWEYATRAGTTTAWFFGDDPADFHEYGWYNEDGRRRTHPVGQKKPNPWGLHDTHGNVGEWTRSRFIFFSGSPRTYDPTFFRPGEDYVFKGGAPDSGIAFSRSASRGVLPKSLNPHNIGFRIELNTK